ncbi:hypothetical protein [Companilactobacillus ginsenosidimutans]|nr:hypothetical protein [Companilactobacillus ginsenosidimutans]
MESNISNISNDGQIQIQNKNIKSYGGTTYDYYKYNYYKESNK